MVIKSNFPCSEHITFEWTRLLSYIQASEASRGSPLFLTFTFTTNKWKNHINNTENANEMRKRNQKTLANIENLA